MKLHIVGIAGQTFIQGATKRYTTQEYEAARKNAERGHKPSIAVLDDIRKGGAVDLSRGFDDCPECQAARARGEVPTVHFEKKKKRRWPRLR